MASIDFAAYVPSLDGLKVHVEALKPLVDRATATATSAATAVATAASTAATAASTHAHQYADVVGEYVTVSSSRAREYLSSDGTVARRAIIAGSGATAAIIVIRAIDRNKTVEITSLDDFLSYQHGGIVRDALARCVITPRVTAVRVADYGHRISSLPSGLFNAVRLRELDIANNAVTVLPPALSRLTALTALNAMGNAIEELPDALGQLTRLVRLGLKGNKLKTLPPSIGRCVALRELFLTDNPLESIPPEIGGCTSLVKLQASHNALSALPDSLGALPHLELLRVAVGNIAALPPAIASSHSIAWLSLAGNPAVGPQSPRRPAPPLVPFKDISLGRELGQGASGEVFEATWRGRRVAFKRFLAHKSPDGTCLEEIAIACALSDRHLVRVLGRVAEPLGLIMEYVDGAPLADKPNSESLLRCRWPADASFKLGFVLRVAAGVATALEAMHARGVVHGDVYAHNVMADGRGHATLVDYGASFYVPRGASAAALEGHEVRAYGLFLRDLVQRLEVEWETMEATLDCQKQLLLVVQQCCTGDPAARPHMTEIVRKLRSLEKSAQGASSSVETTAR